MNEYLYLNEIIRLSIGMVLIMAAYSKTLDVQQFRETLVTTFHFKQGVSYVIAPVVVVAEWAIGLTLLINAPVLSWAMVAALVMFVTFTILVSIFLYRDGLVKCNCFGAQQRPVSIFDMIRNCFCILAICFHLATAKGTAALALDSIILLFGIALSLTFVIVNFHELVSIIKKSA